MLLEAAQLLATPYYTNRSGATKAEFKTIRSELKFEYPDFPRDQFFGIGYYAHPCAKWVQYSRKNWLWLLELAQELGKIFVDERGKAHATSEVVDWFSENEPSFKSEIYDNWLTRPLTLPANATSVKDLPANSWQEIVHIYRLYYVRYKSYMATWKHCGVPEWYETMLSAEDVNMIDLSKIKPTTKVPKILKEKLNYDTA